MPQLDVPVPDFDEPMLVEHDPMDPNSIELAPFPPQFETVVSQEPDDLYAHPELDPFFAEMLMAEGIPFPGSEPDALTIDMDLYDQPFAIASPPPQMDIGSSSSQIDHSISTSEIVPGAYPVHTIPREQIQAVIPQSPYIPPDYARSLLDIQMFIEPPSSPDEGTGSSRPHGISRSYRYEPELVGTSSIQYVPVREMPFVTDPFILCPELRCISLGNNPLAPQPPVLDYKEEELEPLRFASRGDLTPD